MSTGAPLDLSYELMKDLTVLSAGRSPALSPQEGWIHTPNGPPIYSALASANTDGIDVRDNIRARVGVRLRRDPAWIRSWLRCDTADAGQQYGAVITPHPFVTVAGTAGDPTATIAALKVAVDANAAFTTIGVATQILSSYPAILEYAVPGPQMAEMWSGYSGALGNSASAPYQSLMTEARSCHWRIWGRLLGHPHWQALGTFSSWGPADYVDLNCSAFERIYVEVVWADGSVIALVGPCEVDTDRDIPIYDGQLLLDAQDSDAVRLAFPSSLTGAPYYRTTSTDPVTSTLTPTDGEMTEGLDGLTVHYGWAGGTKISVRLEVFNGSSWTRPANTDYVDIESPWCQHFELHGVKRARMDLYANASSSEVYRWYERHDKRRP